MTPSSAQSRSRAAPVVVGKYVMTPEERAWRREQYAERDRRHAATIRAKRAQERALAKEADAARMAVEVARIQAEIRLGLKPPPGRLAAVDTAAMLVIGPQGAVGVSGALLRTLEVLADKGRHPVPSLLAAGPWQDEAALRAALETFRARLLAIGLRVCRRKAGWRLAKAASYSAPNDQLCPTLPHVGQLSPHDVCTRRMICP